MSNQNSEAKNNNKGFLNIIIGLLIGVVAVTAFFKVSDFLEERKIDKRVLENNINAYQTTTTDSELVIDGEPTDLPPYQSDNNTTQINATITDNSTTNNTSNTWNGKPLIGIEEAKKIAIEAIGGGDVISLEEDIYDLEDAPTYDLKIKKGNKIYEVEIDALNGGVLDYDID